MDTYISTFISGLQEPVAELLKSKIEDAKIISLFDGLAVYQSDFSSADIIKLAFFNNSFELIQKFDGLSQEKDPINKMLSLSVNEKKWENEIKKHFSGKNKSFRVIASHENQLVSPNKKLKQKIEEKILKTKGAKLNQYNPDIEFWFLYRSEGAGFFMARLSRNISNKNLQKGELRPELAYMLNYLSEPDKNDVFLDPFSGHGSIPFARLKYFPVNLIFANDAEEEMRAFMKSRIAGSLAKEKIIIKKMDALSMSGFEDGFIGKIVTDPPWGYFEGGVKIEAEKFYPPMLGEFHRVLKPGGIAVILTARKNELESALQELSGKFLLQKKYDILVSGKKAGIYKLLKQV